jgi:hypothetical protein
MRRPPAKATTETEKMLDEMKAKMDGNQAEMRSTLNEWLME